jgi:inosine/xanthosine triphosphatase
VIVRVGSTRPANVEGTRDALQALARVAPQFADFTLEPHDLTAVAPRQPMSLAEIIDGAKARASSLSAVSRNAATFAVGLEGGLHEVMPGVWSLQSWAAVTDGVRWGLGAGPAIVLPGRVVERVQAGEELGDVIDELAGDSVRGSRGAWGVLTLDAIGRRDAFRLAVIAGFAPFYNRRAWGG